MNLKVAAAPRQDLYLKDEAAWPKSFASGRSIEAGNRMVIQQAWRPIERFVRLPERCVAHYLA
jgi:hypothetical protein